MKNPVVSVIMPAYNGEKYINEAIESIINQTYQDWELIIVDDCSLDETVSIVKRYLSDNRIKLYQNENNQGIAASRNKAIQKSNGKYIAIQDDDDISFPERLKEEVRFLDEYEDIDAVAGHWLKVDETGNNILSLFSAYKNPRFVKAHLLLQDCIGNGSAMFRKDIIQKHSVLYRDNMLGMEDYCFWIEFSKCGTISAIDRIVYKQRVHTNQETERNEQNKINERRLQFLELQKKALEMDGIHLSPESIQVLWRMAGEKTDPLLTAQDYYGFYIVCQDIIRQANDMKLDNAEEIAIFCRKFLGKKIANSKGFWYI